MLGMLPGGRLITVTLICAPPSRQQAAALWQPPDKAFLSHSKLPVGVRRLFAQAVGLRFFTPEEAFDADWAVLADLEVAMFPASCCTRQL